MQPALMQEMHATKCYPGQDLYPDYPVLVSAFNLPSQGISRSAFYLSEAHSMLAAQPTQQFESAHATESKGTTVVT